MEKKSSPSNPSSSRSARHSNSNASKSHKDPNANKTQTGDALTGMAKLNEHLKRMPLPEAFMIGSMFALIACLIYTAFGRIDLTWGATFSAVFLIMFISSIVSITPDY